MEIHSVQMMAEQIWKELNSVQMMAEQIWMEPSSAQTRVLQIHLVSQKVAKLESLKVDSKDSHLSTAPEKGARWAEGSSSKQHRSIE